MKLQIDTISKTVRIQESVQIGKLIDQLSKMFPDFKDWKLEIVNEVPNNGVPVYPDLPNWTLPIITCDTNVLLNNNKESGLAASYRRNGIYTLELN